jgi:plastocyanin
MTYRPRILFLATVFVLLVGCSGSGAAASASPPPGVDATIDAKDQKFSAATLTLPAGKPVRVFFRNLDGVPHNLAIYADAGATQKVFAGDNVTNQATTYDVPAIAAGQYTFRCDVHPDMKGTLTVGG